MAEYIEREAFMKALIDENCCTYRGIGLLSRFPTADVAPVVRCKSCIHAKWSNYNKAYYCQRRWAMHKVRERDFCSYGKRRANNG